MSATSKSIANWHIGAVATFFSLSNRMANLINMRPSDEFYTMGRERR